MKHLTTLLLLFSLLLSVLASCQGTAPVTTQEAPPFTEEKTPGETKEPSQVPPSSTVTQTAEIGEKEKSISAVLYERLSEIKNQNEVYGGLRIALDQEMEQALKALEAQEFANLQDGMITVSKETTQLLRWIDLVDSYILDYDIRAVSALQEYFASIARLMVEQNCFAVEFEGGGIYEQDGAFVVERDDFSKKHLVLYYFSDYQKSKSCVFSNEISEIAPYAFSGTTVLEEITLEVGTSIQIASDAFADCPNMTTIRCKYSDYPFLNPKYDLIPHWRFQAYGSFGVMSLNMNYASGGPYQPFTKYDEYTFQVMQQERNKGVPCYPTDDVAEHYVVVDGVLVSYYGIGGHVVIPEGVTEIRGGVFDHCKTNILEVTLPSTLKKICTGAFAGMPMLIALELPEGLEEIEPLAIYEDINSIPFIHITGIPETCKVAENAFHDYQPAR